jgi:hypothetical protein
MPGEPESPRVFISYSHDFPKHEEDIFNLAARLRSDGIETIIDQYEAFPVKGWNVWMREQIREARWVLVICTYRYRLRAEGREDPGKGLGATREGSIIDQEIYEAGGTNTKFIPVVLTAADAEHRPDFLRSYQWFAVDTAYEDLYRLLTNQPSRTKPQLGKLRALKVPEKKPIIAACRGTFPHATPTSQAATNTSARFASPSHSRDPRRSPSRRRLADWAGSAKPRLP